MKLINRRKGQQFCGNRFTATPLRKMLKNMGAMSITGNTARLRYGYVSSSRITGHLSLTRKREFESANDARIEQSQELLAEIEAILQAQKSAFDEIAMGAKEALLSKGDFAGIAPIDHARTVIDLTRNIWIAQGCYKPKIKKYAAPDMQLTQATRITPTDDYAEPLDGISDWARNMIRWRIAAAGAIA